MSNSKFQSKNTVLTKKLNNVIYELMVKTNSDMVQTESGVTLTEKLAEITDLLVSHEKSYEALKKSFDEMMGDSNPYFDSFKEIWDYINVNSNPKSELIQLIDSKQAAEEGKGLSECDFTTILREKLVNGYSKEELDEKFEIILDRTAEDIEERINKLESRPNVVVSESATGDEYDNLPDYSCWYQIISKDTTTV